MTKDMLLHAAEIVGVVTVALGTIAAVVGISSKAAALLRQPPVIGQIAAGLGLGVFAARETGPEMSSFLPETIAVLVRIGQLGVVLFVFTVGREVGLVSFIEIGRKVSLISSVSMAVPLATGLLLAPLIYPYLDHTQMHASLAGFGLYFGVALSVTALPVLAAIVRERGLWTHGIGALALSCAGVQDLFAWMLLIAAVSVVTAHTAVGFALAMLYTILFVLFMIVVARPVLAWALDDRRLWSGPIPRTVIIVSGVILSSLVSRGVGAHELFGAFVFGLIAPQKPHDIAYAKVERAGALLVPVFFVLNGYMLNPAGLGQVNLLLVAGVCFAACASKLVGTGVGAILAGLPVREAAMLAVLMNTRGLTELIILDIGMDSGAIDTELFDALLVAALLSTLMTSPLIALLTRSRSTPGSSVGEASWARTSKAVAPRVLEADSVV